MITFNPLQSNSIQSVSMQMMKYLVSNSTAEYTENSNNNYPEDRFAQPTNCIVILLPTSISFSVIHQTIWILGVHCSKVVSLYPNKNLRKKGGGSQNGYITILLHYLVYMQRNDVSVNTCQPTASHQLWCSSQFCCIYTLPQGSPFPAHCQAPPQFTQFIGLSKTPQKFCLKNQMGQRIMQ